jgi:5-hydroxyisourate hydrolase-like protein (transthyretin family)
VPAALSVSTPSRKVAVGSVVTVSGVVTASDGRPLRNRVVGLVGRSAKKSWAKLATAKTDRNGRVELQTPALSQTTDLQLRTAHQVRSAVVRVVVLPTLDASLTQASGTSTVVVTVQGGQPGDTVSVYRRKAGKNVKVGAAQVDANGTAVFSLTTPQHPVRFVFKLPADRHHGQAQTSLTVGP